jgi:hypothetical protein
LIQNTVGYSGARAFTSDASLLARSGIVPKNVARTRIEVSSPQIRRFPFSLPGGTVNFELEGEEPDWLYPTLVKLQAVASLGPNWDSYGAPSISFRAVLAALRFMVVFSPDGAVSPSVVPSSNGGVQLEWHRYAGDLEVSISPTGTYSASFVDGQSDQEWEMEAGEIDEGILAASVLAVSAAPVD